MLDRMTLTIPGKATYQLELKTGDSTYQAVIFREEPDGIWRPTLIRTPWKATPSEAFAVAVRRLAEGLQADALQDTTRPRRRKDAGTVRVSLKLRGGRDGR